MISFINTTVIYHVVTLNYSYNYIMISCWNWITSIPCVYNNPEVKYQLLQLATAKYDTISKIKITCNIKTIIPVYIQYINNLIMPIEIINPQKDHFQKFYHLSDYNLSMQSISNFFSNYKRNS